MALNRKACGERPLLPSTKDVWIGNIPLKTAYPRIHALALLKEGVISDFGSLENGGWRWNITLRRRLFDWEVQLWNDFANLLNSVASGSYSVDSLRWAANSNSFYSPKSFCILAKNANNGSDDLWRLVWANVAPPKAEVFLWRLLLGKIPIMVELAKRGVLHRGSIGCPLFSSGNESINHLFCHCRVSWALWQHFCSIWNIQLVMPGMRLCSEILLLTRVISLISLCYA
ncbi:hypothetical protein V6N13_083578 [Hibiscus sabdariffa]